MLLAAPVYAEVLLEEVIHILPSFIYLELSYKMICFPYKNSEGTIAIIYYLSTTTMIWILSFKGKCKKYHLMVVSISNRKF